MSRNFAMFLCAVMGMLPLAVHADGPSVSATHVWIRTSIPETDTMTGYLVLQNLSSQALTLMAISSPDFKSVVIRGGQSDTESDKVQKLANVNIPAHESLAFTPDNYYLMLTKPVKKYYDGDLVTLTLAFSDHSSLTIMAPIRTDQPKN
jgi:periplasmic copper chaperone A